MSSEIGLTNLSNSRNPLIGRGAGRLILEIPFDDSIASGFPIECFFQMPAQVRGIRSAQVWVQAKPFRQYGSASSGASAGGPHAHAFATGIAAKTTDAGGADSHSHGYGDDYALSGTSDDSPAHTHSIDTTLTPGIAETAATGTLALFVADDGLSYGAAVVTGVAVATGITKQSLLPQLTKGVGDKRIKITGTNLCRVQVLLMLDLRIAVLA